MPQKEYRIARVDDRIAYSPELIKMFNDSIRHHKDVHPHVPICVQKDSAIFSVYNKADNYLMGFAILNDNTDSGFIYEMSIIVHPMACKMAIIRIFNAMSHYLQKHRRPCEFFTMYSDAGILGIQESCRFADSIIHCMDFSSGESRSYFYMFPNKFKDGEPNSTDSAVDNIVIINHQ